MFGNELLKARDRTGLTQEELAYRAGISRNYVSLLEHDKKSPTLDVVFRLCAILDVKASTLIARVERNKQTK